jgi:hypothetical protein
MEEKEKLVVWSVARPPEAGFEGEARKYFDQSID